MSQSIKIGLIGATGRMGGEVLSNAFDSERTQVVAAVAQGDTLVEAIGPQGLEVTDDPGHAARMAEVLIDFSSPDGFESALVAAREEGIPLVSGTTGLTDKHRDAVEEGAQEIPVLLAANFSVGVNAIERLVELASGATGDGWDIEVFEAHHNKKVDAPSGTALFLGEAAARGRDLSLDEDAVWSRHGHTGARDSTDIGFQVLRGGDIVGEHTIYFCGAGERIQLTHRATDRGIFARGALRAARWIVDQPPGTYSMKDVLFD